MFLSERSERNQRIAGGVSPVNTAPKAGVHSRLTPRPPNTGDALLENGHLRPALRTQDLASFLPRGHRPLRRRKVRSIPDAQAWASVMSLPCSSSPHQTRFAGLWRGPRLSVCAVRTPPTLAELWQLVRNRARAAARPPPHRTGRDAPGGVR